MVRHPALLILLWSALASQASAGPWMRAKGVSFLSTSTETLMQSATTQQPYTAVYYEYGLTQRLTVGVDAGFRNKNDWSGALFVTTPLWQTPKGNRVAVEFAVGYVVDAQGRSAVIRPALEWGYGFSTKWGTGWTSTRASYAKRIGAGVDVIKAEATVGLRPTTRMTLMIQASVEALTTGTSTGRTTYKLGPSVAWQFKSGVHLTAALSHQLQSKNLAITFGVWQEF